MVSPFARRGYVASEIYDHASVLKMIEWRFGLDPLSVRDAEANNLADVLDFDRRQQAAGAYDVPGFFSPPCIVTAP